MTTEPRQEALRVARELDRAWVRFQEERTGERLRDLEGVTARLVGMLTAVFELDEATDEINSLRHERSDTQTASTPEAAHRAQMRLAIAHEEYGKALSALREEQTHA